MTFGKCSFRWSLHAYIVKQRSVKLLNKQQQSWEQIWGHKVERGKEMPNLFPLHPWHLSILSFLVDNSLRARGKLGSKLFENEV